MGSRTVMNADSPMEAPWWDLVSTHLENLNLRRNAEAAMQDVMLKTGVSEEQKNKKWNEVLDNTYRTHVSKYFSAGIIDCAIAMLLILNSATSWSGLILLVGYVFICPLLCLRVANVVSRQLERSLTRHSAYTKDMCTLVGKERGKGMFEDDYQMCHILSLAADAIYCLDNSTFWYISPVTCWLAAVSQKKTSVVIERQLASNINSLKKTPQGWRIGSVFALELSQDSLEIKSFARKKRLPLTTNKIKVSEVSKFLSFNIDSLSSRDTAQVFSDAMVLLVAGSRVLQGSKKCAFAAINNSLQAGYSRNEAFTLVCDEGISMSCLANIFPYSTHLREDVYIGTKASIMYRLSEHQGQELEGNSKIQMEHIGVEGSCYSNPVALFHIEEKAVDLSEMKISRWSSRLLENCIVGDSFTEMKRDAKALLNISKLEEGPEQPRIASAYMLGMCKQALEQGSRDMITDISAEIGVPLVLSASERVALYQYKLNNRGDFRRELSKTLVHKLTVENSVIQYKKNNMYLSFEDDMIQLKRDGLVGSIALSLANFLGIHVGAERIRSGATVVKYDRLTKFVQAFETDERELAEVIYRAWMANRMIAVGAQSTDCCIYQKEETSPINVTSGISKDMFLALGYRILRGRDGKLLFWRTRTEKYHEVTVKEGMAHISDVEVIAIEPKECADLKFKLVAGIIEQMFEEGGGSIKPLDECLTIIQSTAEEN